MKEIMLNLQTRTKPSGKSCWLPDILSINTRTLQIVLQRAQGKSAQAIADHYSVGRSTVSTIVNRYNKGSVKSLLRDKTRKSGTVPVSIDIKNNICETACHEKPKNVTPWSVRELAKKFGTGKTTVNTLLRERDIKPHKVKIFTFSTDEHFKEKLTCVLGLYLNPPDNAIVLAALHAGADEKSEVQALERSAPLLPHIPPGKQRITADALHPTAGNHHDIRGS